MHMARDQVGRGPLAALGRWGAAAVLCAAVLCASPLRGAAPRSLVLATTTSTQDSGLLDELVPLFEQASGLQVKTVAVGSGQAMALGRRGEADVLLVHSPDDEAKFMAEGLGIHRLAVMHNDFLLVGPASAPLQGARTTAEALRLIWKAAFPFVSRGDQSGTHAQERRLWKAAGLDPESPARAWYLQTGQGMGQTLRVASEKRACTLSDRGTWLALRKGLGLSVLVEGEPALLNRYHVIQVDPARFPRVNGAAARAFADFIVSAPIQERIRSFGVQKYGSPLFFPDAGKGE